MDFVLFFLALAVIVGQQKQIAALKQRLDALETKA